MGKDRYKLVANNKKAYHDYFIDETYEAGVALHGTEVKSVRMGKCSAVAAGKGILGADAKARLDDEDRTVGHGRKRGKIFADPLCTLGPSAQAEGDVRTASDGNLLELLQRKTALGQMI